MQEQNLKDNNANCNHLYTNNKLHKCVANNVHSHNHGNLGHIHTNNKVVLKNSFLIIFIFMVVETIGGFITSSLALLSDAGHMLSDSAALAISLLAFKFSEKKATLKNTFGFKRIEILAATINATALFAIAIFIIIEAFTRFSNPPKIATTPMLVVSLIGLGVNIFVAWYMLKNADTKDNINVRGAYLHVLGDMLGSFGATIAALAMIYFNWWWADALASVLVAILILKSALEVLKQSLHVLMEGTPKNINLDKILNVIKNTKGVNGVHDLHIWSITSSFNALIAHVTVDGNLSVKEAQKIIQNIEYELLCHNISHVTLQTESENLNHSDELVCKI